MADATGLTPPILDPSQYPAYLDAQRKQQLAQTLMSSLQQANQTPSDWNQMKVVPKRGMLQNVSVLADALLAGKAMRDSQQAQQQYFQGIYGNGQPSSAPQPTTGPGAGIISPDAPQAAQDAAQAVTNMPAGGGLAAAPASAAAPQPSHNPMIPPGMTPGSAQSMLSMMGPEMYAKTFLAPQFQTPEIVAQLRSAGINPTSPQGQAIQRGALTKATALESRPGGTIIDPVSGRTMVGADPSKGEYYATGPDGTVTAYPIENDATIQAWRTGLTTAATQANTPREIPMGGGKTAFGYPQDVLPNSAGVPPALRATSPTSNGPGQQPNANAPPRPTAGGTAASASNASPSAPALPQKDSSGILSNNLWSSIPKMQIPTTPGQTTDAYQQKIIDSAAAKHQELVNKYGEQSAAGTQQLEYLTEAEKALPNAEVGPMSEWLTHNRGMLVQQFPQLAGALGGDKVTPTLELNKQLTNAALQGARSTFGTRMTQNEVNLQKDEMSPNPGMTRDALASLINQAKMKAAYSIQQDKDYSDYHAQNGDPNRFESQYNVMRPITRFSAQYQTPAPALDRLKTNPALLPDFKAKYGWDPTR
jgi:hypothetical protein